jgi:hypothetical protein
MNFKKLQVANFASERQKIIKALRDSPDSSDSNLKWTTMASHLSKVNRPYKPLKSFSKWDAPEALEKLLTPPQRLVKFGDYVQIRSETGLTLSFDLWTTSIPIQDQGPLKDYLLLASGSQGKAPKPISRNVFQIVKVPNEEYEDDIVRNGVKIKLITPAGRFEKQVDPIVFFKGFFRSYFNNVQ